MLRLDDGFAWDALDRADPVSGRLGLNVTPPQVPSNPTALGFFCSKCDWYHPPLGQPNTQKHSSLGMPGPTHLVPDGLLGVNGQGAENRQDFEGAVRQRVEVVRGSKAQDTRSPGRGERVLGGSAEGRDQDSLPGLERRMGEEDEVGSGGSWEPSCARRCMYMRDYHPPESGHIILGPLCSLQPVPRG